MHVIKDGKIIDGAESFLIIWKNVPKYHFLYKIFKIKPLFFMLNIFYEIVAYFLFIKNKHLLKNEKNWFTVKVDKEAPQTDHLERIVHFVPAVKLKVS